MDTGSTISLASLALGIVVASGGYLTRKKPLNVQSQGLAEGERFRHIRQLQASQHDELYKLALAQGDAHRADADLPLLTLPGWIPSAPVPLQDVQLEWQAAPGPSLTPALQRAQALWPHTAAGTRMPDYVSAINEHTPAGSAYFNGASFRLLAVSPTPAFSMKLTEGWYFDALNTTEVLGYEAASVHQRKPGTIVGPYRRGFDSPFDLAGRCALPGVSVLTIGKSDTGPRFYLHKRSGSKVSVARDVFHVAPAGEFQPSDISREALTRDFDLWRCIMREYAEELLGYEDARGQGGIHLDYEHTPPFSLLQEARRDGEVALHFLGLGLDPLTWKPEILVVAVFEADTFRRLFSAINALNEEGTLVLGEENRGLPFDAAAVARYGVDSGTLAAGQAVLALAWRHRSQLNLY